MNARGLRHGNEGRRDGRNGFFVRTPSDYFGTLVCIKYIIDNGCLKRLLFSIER